MALKLFFGKKKVELPPGRKVLLIEDDPYWQRMISAAVKNIDHQIEVICVQNVVESMKYIDDPSVYDLVIADQYVPGPRTGLDLWREFRKFHRDVPFVLVSGIPEATFLNLVEAEAECPLFIGKNQGIDGINSVLNFHLGKQADQKM